MYSIHMDRILIASGNPGKLRELRHGLGPLGIQIRPQSEFEVPEAEETGTTFVENAIIKARNAARHTGLPALGDDSGLRVDALAGAPGVLSSRYAGAQASDQDNNRKLLTALQGQENRRASFVCVLALMQSATDPTPQLFQGQWTGEIMFEARGEGGFGYDPLFLVSESDRSAAQLTSDEKDRLSHRGIAMRSLIEALNTEVLKT
jgi:XTP/dITP diphosphohydrolase